VLQLLDKDVREGGREEFGRREAETNWEAQEADLFMNLEELFGNFVTERVPKLAVSSIKLGDLWSED